VMFVHLLLSASHMPIPVSAGTLARNIVAGIDSGISACTDVNSYSDDSNICLYYSYERSGFSPAE